MVKPRSLRREIGKNLASLATGIGLTLGVFNTKAEDLIPINSVTNLVPFVSGRTSHYVCNDVKFNNRSIPGKVILFYDYFSGTTNRIIGGLTIGSNSTNTIFSESYLQGKKTTIPIIQGLLNPQVATNGLNGTSEWFGAIDLNNNGVSIYKGANTGNLYFEEGEYVGPAQISFVNMGEFPVDKTSTVYVTSLRIKGYQEINGNGVPDYFEAKYPDIIGLPAGNDFDQDGLNNYQEWVAGTNPTNAASVFSIDSMGSTLNATSVSFNSLEGRVYDILSKTNLVDSGSVPLSMLSSGWETYSTTNGTGQVINYEIPRDPAKPQEFYSVGVSLGPDEVVNP